MAEREPRRRYTMLREIESDILDLLRFQVGERDAKLYGQWHMGVPLKKLEAEFGLHQNSVEQITKDVDRWLESSFAPTACKCFWNYSLKQSAARKR